MKMAITKNKSMTRNASAKNKTNNKNLITIQLKYNISLYSHNSIPVTSLIPIPQSLVVYGLIPNIPFPASLLV